MLWSSGVNNGAYQSIFMYTCFRDLLNPISVVIFYFSLNRIPNLYIKLSAHSSKISKPEAAKSGIIETSFIVCYDCVVDLQLVQLRWKIYTGYSFYWHINQHET